MNLSPGFLSDWLYQHSNIWQMDFCDSNKFVGFAKDYGIDFPQTHIQPLWQIGLLKADFVLSANELQIEGLSSPFGENLYGQYWYSDERISQYPKGLSDLLKGLEELPYDIKPYFHPFRYAVLMYLAEILRPSISPIQELLYSAGSVQILERWKTWFAEYTSSQEFLDDLHYHEEVAKLCIATEPCTYQLLFSKVKRPVFIDEETQERQVEDYSIELMGHYKELGIKQIEEARRRLCIAAKKLDPNKDVHNILRLTNGEMRMKRIKGKLGGAIYLLTMAEMLRRFAEQAFDTQLPEEDELGFGRFPKDLKKSVYDSSRLFDGNRRSANLFLRQWGLDYGVRLRWYVEGDTELGALECLFADYHSVELINLRGQVAERGGKGLTFRENLLNDLRAQIFSFVIVDSDVSDNLRVVRKAAEKDEICGGFFISAPNFDEMNFTLYELKDILWGIAVENGATPEQREPFKDATSDVESINELINSARRSLPILNQEGKGRKWGAKLIQYAWGKQDMPPTNAGESKIRPIIEAALAALRAQSANYLYTRRNYMVDPLTGKLVQRNVKE